MNQFGHFGRRQRRFFLVTTLYDPATMYYSSTSGVTVCEAGLHCTPEKTTDSTSTGITSTW
jgi:hypothetical protein